MAVRYNDTDFMYSSARIRSLENSVIGKEKLEHMIDAESSDDILASLGEYGFESVRKENGVGDICREDTLLSVLKNAYGEVSKMCESQGLLDFLRYQYDCNNIKAVLKCNIRGVDPSDMLFDFGTVSIEKIKEIIRDKDYASLPKNMGEALPKALEAFGNTSNPQKIDLILDRACFADMSASAQESGVPYVTELVRMKIDLVNIITCIRIMDMKLYQAADSFMQEAFIEGGNYGNEFFADAIEFGKKKLFEVLELSPYSPLCNSGENENTPLYVLEKIADNILMDKAKEAKSIPFGAAVSVGYIIALEYEVKNLRILLAAKDAGLSKDVIKERLRESYV